MESKSVSIARTVVCPLETSERKREYLRDAIEQYQDVCSTAANMLPSINRSAWEAKNSTIDRTIKKETSPHTLYAHDRNDAAFKVAEAFDSKTSNGHRGELPSFGDGNYIRVCSCCGRRAKVVSNDSGFGLFVDLHKGRDGEWFHLNGGDYQYDALDAIVNGDAALGNVEIHCNDEDATAHVTYTRDVEVPKFEDVQRYVGVDVGERVLYAAAVRDETGTIERVEMETGDEQRHHKERLSERQDRRQASGRLDAARGVSARRRYTEHVMDVASREIVDLAADHRPCGIVLEDLTGYREQASNPLHEWPYASLHEKICHKAREARIPVEQVDAKYTSQMCRKCEVVRGASRNGVEFECVNCGYTVHADVNAACNIAARGQREADTA